MTMNPGKLIILMGVILVIVGLFMTFVGKLPGDISFKKGNVSFHFPIMTSIIDLLKKDNQATIPEHYKNLTEVEMKERVIKIKKELGNKLFIPAHHYQKNEVVEFADTTGDSLQLAQECAKNEEAQFIVFCGVHFKAETADMLTNDEQTVLLPDLRAGCSLADMADIKQTEICWEVLNNTFGD